MARRLAVRRGLLDLPAERKDHVRPMPLLGGLAIYGAVLGSLLLFHDRPEIVELSAILVGATLISFVGLWDDHRGLPLRYKLLGQCAAALVLLLSGVQVRLPVAGWLDVLITLAWVLGITNALNLLDNMDGLAGGIGAVAAGGFVVLAGLNGQFLVAALSAALLGACMGFLLYNFNPARVFMGDSGSLFLGFVLAAAGIKLRFPHNVPWVTWMVPVLVLGLPVFDTTLVVVSRLRRRRNPLTSPGKDHLSHRLTERGLSRRGAVLVLYCVGAVLGVAAIAVSRSSELPAYTIGLVVLALAVIALHRFEYGRPGARLGPPSERLEGAGAVTRPDRSPPSP